MSCPQVNFPNRTGDRGVIALADGLRRAGFTKSLTLDGLSVMVLNNKKENFMKHASDKLIDVSPDVCHGQPRFAKTRIMVWQVLELLEAGISSAEITSKKYFPRLTQKHIRAALHYAAEQFKNREFVAFSKP